MSMWRVSILLMVLAFSSGCIAAPTPTPTPIPTSTPSPTATLESPTGLLPTPVGNRSTPADVPACKGALVLDQPIQFSWAGIDDVVQSTPETNWTYYRCDGSRAALSAFYRQWMPTSPYGWIETYWEERAEATLGVYFYSTGTAPVPSRWLYLWFLPENSDSQSSNLVAAWWNVPHSC